MSFEKIKGQELAKCSLLNALESDRLPSAFLFLGAHGIGKTTVALALANEFFHRADNLEKIKLQVALSEQGEHPDIIILKKDPNFIRIDKIRELNNILYKPPALSPLRVCILKSAENLTEEAANALLKTLEEPPPNNLLILTAQDQNELSETVLSRCEKIFFAPLKPEELREVYLGIRPILKKDLDFLLRFSPGRVRKTWCDNLETLQKLRQESGEMLLDLSLYAVLGHFAALEKIAEENREKEFLEFLFCWLRDVSHACAKTNEPFINEDLPDILSKLRGKFDVGQAESCLEIICETERSLQLHTGKQVALEGMILLFRRVFEGVLFC